jgi:hypothetical protein
MQDGSDSSPKLNPKPAQSETDVFAIGSNSVTQSLKAAGDAAEDTKKKVNGTTAALKEVDKAAPRETANVLKTISAAIGTFMGGEAGENAKKILGGVGTFATGLITSITDNAKNLAGAAFVSLDEGARKMANPLEGMGFLTNDTKLSGLNLAMKALLETQQTMRVGFIRMGQSIADSEAAATNYPNTIRRISASYGMQGKEIDGMMKSLQGIPIITDQVTQMSLNAVAAQYAMVDATASLARVSSTFGMSSSEASALASMAYRQFNQTVEETIDTMATMSSAAKDSGVDRRIANDQIMEASKGLALFGQKSDSAAGTWLTFMKALKDTTPIDQVGSITEQVTKSIATMSVQNRAFIGMMSGMAQGRSALGGAIQMEMMMRSPEGMQKHLESLTSTLAQFAGGQIITLEEAAQNPQLEVSFQMQREMIGKLMGITDAQVQNKILETLKNVQSGGMSQVDGAKELGKIQSEGKSIQDKQLTAIEKLDQHLAIWFQDAFNIDTSLDKLNSFSQGDTGERYSATEGWLADFNKSLSARQQHDAGKESGKSFRSNVGDASTQPDLQPYKTIFSDERTLSSPLTRMAAQAARPGALTEAFNEIKWGTRQFNKEAVDLGTAFKTVAQAAKNASDAIGGIYKVKGEEKKTSAPTDVMKKQEQVVEQSAEEARIKNAQSVERIGGVPTGPIAVAGANVTAPVPPAPETPPIAEQINPYLSAQALPTTVAPPPLAAASAPVPVTGAAAHLEGTSGVTTPDDLFKSVAKPTAPTNLKNEVYEREIDNLAPSERPTLAEPHAGTGVATKPTVATASANNKNELLVRVDVTSDLAGIQPYIDKGVKAGIEEWAKNQTFQKLTGNP